MEHLTLGIEFGSTRIKSVLIDQSANVLAQGGYEWQNQLVDGLWSYPLEEALVGLKVSYKALAENYKAKTGNVITALDAIGISGMMHGYLALDENDDLLVPFRTWRNTNTQKASDELSELFAFHVPMRWSVSQYYQSVLEGLPHIPKVRFLTTLAGYVHYLLTGEKVLGIDDASGMFPVDGNTYDQSRMQKFNALLAGKGVDGSFEALLPKVLLAGQPAGRLTEAGAKLLDESGNLQAGIPFCPPEGDMGTGIIATNSVKKCYANVSAGTSANLTVVLEKPLKSYYPEVDVIATPDGRPCALLHSNNCTTELDEWANLFREILGLYGVETSKGELLDKLFAKSAESDGNVGGVVSYNYLAGEPMAKVEKGCPLVARKPDGKLNLANFMQAEIYSAISALSLGLELLVKEDVRIKKVLGHGGYYKAENVGQFATSAALGGVPVTVTETAGEGGAWGMALLALYLNNNTTDLPTFLDRIFAGRPEKTLTAKDTDITKFRNYFSLYKKLLPAERLAGEGVEDK